MKFWSVKNMHIYSTYIAHQECTIVVLISEAIKMENICWIEKNWKEHVEGGPKMVEE